MYTLYSIYRDNIRLKSVNAGFKYRFNGIVSHDLVDLSIILMHALQANQLYVYFCCLAPDFYTLKISTFIRNNTNNIFSIQ